MEIDLTEDTTEGKVPLMTTTCTECHRPIEWSAPEWVDVDEGTAQCFRDDYTETSTHSPTRSD